MPTNIRQQGFVHDVPKDIRESLLGNIINSKAHPPTFTCCEKHYVKGDIALISHAKGKTINNNKDEVNRV